MPTIEVEEGLVTYISSCPLCGDLFRVVETEINGTKFYRVNTIKNGHQCFIACLSCLDKLLEGAREYLLTTLTPEQLRAFERYESVDSARTSIIILD